MEKLQKLRYDPDIGAFVLHDENRRILACSLSDEFPDVERMQEEHDAPAKPLRISGLMLLIPV